MGWTSYGVNVLSTYICVLYMCIPIYMFNLLSSPYLFVFGDDRVRGTREQLMLM